MDPSYKSPLDLRIEKEKKMADEIRNTVEKLDGLMRDSRTEFGMVVDLSLSQDRLSVVQVKVSAARYY